VRSLSAGADVRAALTDIADGFAPDTLALGIVNAEAMGIEDELVREASLRRARIAGAVTHRLERDQVEPLRADVIGAALGGAVLAAVHAWAYEGAGRAPLQPTLERALAIVTETLP